MRIKKYPLYEIKSSMKLDSIKHLFTDIRFYMAKSALEGLMGKVYVDNIKEPKICFVILRNYCFISGNVDSNNLRGYIDYNFEQYKLIPSDNIANQIEEIYANNYLKNYRYSLKKTPKFNIDDLEKFSSDIDKKFKIIKIDNMLADRIKKENFITITDDYKKYGIGFCCMYDKEIIGVASSNIFYKDGIEVNIKVKEEYRRKGIGKALASSLIIECISQRKTVSWDAANLFSVGLAEKLGFEYDSKYATYNIIF